LGQGFDDPPPPWHYSGDVLAFLNSGPTQRRRPRCCLRDSPGPEHEWTCVRHVRRLAFHGLRRRNISDPARYQYRRGFRLIRTRSSGSGPSPSVLVIYVDNERHWRALGPRVSEEARSIFQTRTHAAPSPARRGEARRAFRAESYRSRVCRLENARVTLAAGCRSVPPSSIDPRHSSVFPPLAKGQQDQPRQRADRIHHR